MEAMHGNATVTQTSTRSTVPQNAAPLGIVVLACLVACGGAGDRAALPPVPPKPVATVDALKAGDAVFGQWTDGNWYPGKIGKLNADGTYTVNYDDGDVSPALPAAKVRRPPDIAVPSVAPTIPDTPAGKILSAWLDVFNSGDAARMRAFGEQYKAPYLVDPGFRKETGGFQLIAISASAPLAITFVVKNRTSPITGVGWLKLERADPVEIGSLRLRAIPPGLTAADMDRKLDAATRTRVLDAIAAKLVDLYVFPDVAKKMAQALRDHAKQGVYDAVGESLAFAELLTEHLQAVSHDRHLHIDFMPTVIPEREVEPDKQRMREQLEGMNCGFQKAERLDGNIGYLKFNMFGDPGICGPKATAAFGSLGEVDALIVDLTENGGGDSEMVAFMASYLFAKRTHLTDIYERKENKTTENWTKPDVPGKKLVDQPVYVLTAQRTFSAAEDFAYSLQSLKRATIVGETTGGGAHPTMGARLDDHFRIAVPFARSINWITKTNWEGTGVVPDVKVPAAEALAAARKLAAERIAKKKR
jgi:retinol-binding protein 3